MIINGEQTEVIPASDRGLHYGDGLFETLAVVTGHPRLWDAHMERLRQGCTRLGIPVPDEQLLLEEVYSLCQCDDKSVIKLIITRGTGGRGYAPPQLAEPSRLVIRYAWPDFPDTTQGIGVRFCDTPLACNPALAGIKHLNRLEQVLARAEWNDSAVHEGLMSDLDGQVKEGTMSNLFWVVDGTLYTPDLSRCGVAGVMRAEVMSLAHDLGIPLTVTEIQPDALLEVDEVFITNSLITIWPVTRIDGRPLPVGEITSMLIAGLQQRLGAHQ